MKLAITFVGLLVALTVTVLSGMALSQWERENGYPFGQMCNSIFTGYANTCPAK
jgi:hypothetical protein